MESFEHLCRVALEAEGFVVTGNVKFPVRRRTRKADRVEYQEHGYEVDLVAARGEALVLAEVKSYFGSQGISRQGFVALADPARTTHYERYKLLNDVELRQEIEQAACERYGYRPDQVRMRLYAGRFAPGHEPEVVAHLAGLSPPVEVVPLAQVVDVLLTVAKRRTYVDDPVVTTVKALALAGALRDAAG